MGFLKNIFRSKTEKVEEKKFDPTEYIIDIDPDSDSFSIAFKDFYKNHFIDPVGLIHRDVDLYFFKSMTAEEKEIAKRLVRQNLKLRRPHLFRASWKLQDKEALPILYEQFQSNTNFSWQLTIGQAIWKLNGDELYPQLLRKLKKHPSESMRYMHFTQITDLENEESIEMLFDYLNDKSRLVKSMAVSIINYLENGKDARVIQHDRKYFIAKRGDMKFKNHLLFNLKTLYAQRDPRY